MDEWDQFYGTGRGESSCPPEGHFSWSRSSSWGLQVPDPGGFPGPHAGWGEEAPGLGVGLEEKTEPAFGPVEASQRASVLTVRK